MQPAKRDICRGLTYNFPSRVLIATTVFSESVAIPVTACILFSAANFLAFALDFAFPLAEAMIPGLESPGGGPVREKVRLSFPDCIFHIRISPVDDPARPKLPQAVTQTA